MHTSPPHPGNFWKHLALSCVATLALLAPGCSVVQEANPFPEKNARCELRPAKDQCTDWRKFQGPSMAAIQGLCTSLAAAVGYDKGGAGGWSEGQICDPVGALGGCQTTMGDGTLQTNWFYQGEKYKSVEDAKTNCDKATWVTP